MANCKNIFEGAKNYMFKHYAQDTGKMLLYTGTIGWIFSAAGQIMGMANNKKLSKKEKQFLIPQECFDAIVNIASFFIVTRYIQNSTGKLISKGKIITPTIRKFCEENNIKFLKVKGEKSPNIGEAIKAKAKEYQTLLDIDKNDKGLNLNLGNTKTDQISQKRKTLNEFYDTTYAPLESGFQVAGSIIGTVVSGNIITPLLRNPMAAWKQKNTMEQEKLEHDAKLYNENKVILAQNSLDSDKTKPNTIINPRITSGGSMRI